MTTPSHNQMKTISYEVRNEFRKELDALVIEFWQIPPQEMQGIMNAMPQELLFTDEYLSELRTRFEEYQGK